jgi:hypothetical protein
MPRVEELRLVYDREHGRYDVYAAYSTTEGLTFIGGTTDEFVDQFKGTLKDYLRMCWEHYQMRAR